MNSHRLGHVGLVLLIPVLLSACGSASSEEANGGPAVSDLAPTFDPTRGGAHSKESDPGHDAGGRRTRSEDTATTRGPRADPTRRSAPERTAGAEPAPRGRDRGAPDDETQVAGEGGPATSGQVSISDPTGDLSASPEGAPASADIVDVTLEVTGGRVEVRTTFAGPVPSSQSGSKGMNVASFYDVDGNGYVDYEVWASLADDGWGTGYLDDRRNKASFGPSTGIEVTVDGKTLVTRFPVDRIGGARQFQWSAASEWGSYESMSTSTSARDHAPDQGAAAYPG